MDVSVMDPWPPSRRGAAGSTQRSPPWTALLLSFARMRADGRIRTDDRPFTRGHWEAKWHVASYQSMPLDAQTTLADLRRGRFILLHRTATYRPLTGHFGAACEIFVR